MRVVLLGGGHAHALALPQVARHCRPLLVSENERAPYSGMLPGYIAGAYARDDCFIHLPTLAKQTGADFLCGRATGVAGDEVLLEGGGRARFDALSVNTGAAPRPPFAVANGCAVKPIGEFMRALQTPPAAGAALAVVGGGAGGVEVALALAARFAALRPRLALVCSRFLPGFPPAFGAAARRAMRAQGVVVQEQTAIGYADGELLLANGARQPADFVVFATPAAAPAWLANTPFAKSEGGFIAVNERLQSVSHPAVFAAGDVAAPPFAVAKSGVVAVRQAPTLARNLPAAAGLTRAPMRAWRGGKAALYIVGCGNGKALACRNGITVGGAWAWRFKRRLDSQFMRRFPRPPAA